MKARVERVLAASARIADPADLIGVEARARLLSSSGLSREGIELALTQHLERAASPSELDAFVARAGAAPRCHVVLSANVCTAATRAIAFGVATASQVFVRPSRRDPVVAELLARLLAADLAFAGRVEIVETITPAPPDEVHVYGGEQAVAAYREALPNGATLRAHGPGFGVAWIGARDGLSSNDLIEAAAALARDVVPFDQRGCLSPRVALVEGDAARGEAFARALHAALEAAEARVPRGAIDAATAAELTNYRSTLDAVGACFVGSAHLVGFDARARALLLPPAARVVHVVAASAEELVSLLEPLASHLTTVGVTTDGVPAELARRRWGFRPAALGCMQAPPFDGPVDLR